MKMKRNITYSLIAFFAFISIASAQEVVELKLPESVSVAVKLSFRNGSMVDPIGKEGLTNLTSQVLVQTGNDKLTKVQIDEILYPMAAYYTAFTDKEMTTITFEVHKDHLDKFYEIFKGVLLNPAFAESDFNRVKSNVKNFVDQVIKTNDEEYSKMALESQLYKGTRYEHMKQGTSQGLASITLDDVKNHYRNFFTRNNVILGISGNYDSVFLNKLKGDVNSLPDVKPVIPSAPKPKYPEGINVQLIAKPKSLGTAIFTGYPIEINRASKDWPAMLIVNSYLGEHRKSYSKLYQVIREKRSMNYGDYTYIEWYESGGSNMLPATGFPRGSNYFSIWIRPVQSAYSLKSQYPEMKDVNVGHGHFALRIALKEIARVKEKGISKEEFELTKQFLRSYMKLYVQTPERRLGFLVDSRFYGQKDYITEMDKALEKVTLQEVNEAARKYLQIDNMYVTMIVDEEEAEPLKQSLLSSTPSPMNYSQAVKESLTEDIFKEDKEVESFKLNVKQVSILKPSETFVK